MKIIKKIIIWLLIIYIILYWLLVFAFNIEDNYIRNKVWIIQNLSNTDIHVMIENKSYKLATNKTIKLSKENIEKNTIKIIYKDLLIFNSEELPWWYIDSLNKTLFYWNVTIKNTVTIKENKKFFPLYYNNKNRTEFINFEIIDK